MSLKKFIFKILVVGAPNVGKNSFLHKFDLNNFYNIYETKDTLGANYYCINYDFDSLQIQLLIWDINARPRFIFLYPSFYSGAKGCVLCFNIANRNSFNRLHNWIKFIRLNAGNIPIILVGTKSDLHHEVSEKEISDLVRNFNLCGVYLTSINEPFKRDIIFEHLAQEIVRKRFNLTNFFHISFEQQFQFTYEEKKERLVNNLSRNYHPSNIQIVQTPSILGTNENIRDATFEIICRESNEIQSQNINELSDFTPDSQNIPLQERDGEEVPVSRNSLRAVVMEELGSLLDIAREPTDPVRENAELWESTSLREEMLDELGRLRRIMNGEDEIDENFYDNLTAEEKVILDNFMEFFSTCPVCNQKNHRNYLRRFYFDTNVEKIRLKERLLALMEDASEFDDNYYNKIVLGIPCCDCFKNIF